MSRQLIALLLGLLNFLQLTSSHPTPEPDAPQSPAHALIPRVGKYYLECTHGKSAAACLTIYGTYCDDNGKIINNASIGKENGGCSSIYRYCYCELNEFHEPGIGAAIAGMIGLDMPYCGRDAEGNLEERSRC